jgi:hypothetical protein
VKKLECLSCDYIWKSVSYIQCPKCKSTDVFDENDMSDSNDFDNGHFEGDMISPYYMDDSGDK